MRQAGRTSSKVLREALGVGLVVGEEQPAGIISPYTQSDLLPAMPASPASPGVAA